MLDTNIKFSIEASLPVKTEESPKVLLLRACNMYLYDENQVYSEFEEQTFDALNLNEGFGSLNIEFTLDKNIVNQGYPQFYTKCFVIRTDTGLRIKPMKSRNDPNSSKINQNGELIIGICYYFKNEEEVKEIIKSKKILVEGFIALENVTNVFGIMCQLQKSDPNWEIATAYTYKPCYAKNIKHLID